MKTAADALQSVSNTGNAEEISKHQDQLMASAESVLGEWLDKEKGKDVTENSIFADLPRHFENEFNKDMDALNVCIDFVLLVARVSIVFSCSIVIFPPYQNESQNGTRIESILNENLY